jgi:hypothetical protein
VEVRVEETDFIEVVVPVAARGINSFQKLQLSDLKSGVEVFLSKISSIFDNIPSAIGEFDLKEFTVTAEINAQGSLSILGTGIQTSGKGGITFKFVKP